MKTTRLLTLTLVCGLLSSLVFAAEAPSEFIRVVEDEAGRADALQLAIVSYRRQYSRSRVNVDLISAIHIGDAAYYAQLNEQFRHYDALLYELVAPPGAVVSRSPDERKGLISNAQIGLKNLLGLNFQLDEIVYDRPNFVHADLSPSELRQSMVERDESLYVYFWRVFYASVNDYARDPLGIRDWQMLSAMLSSGDDGALKVMIAHEMTNMDQIRKILGDDSESAVIGARNERAVEVLKAQLAKGDKHIGIFYGVAHMPDIERRLIEELKLKPYKTTWIDAWAL